MIFCQYLKQQETALEKPPFPGELGCYIQEHISQKAWQIWLDEQVKLINENRLSLARPADRAFLKEQLCAFFEIGSERR